MRNIDRCVTFKNTLLRNGSPLFRHVIPFYNLPNLWILRDINLVARVCIYIVTVHSRAFAGVTARERM